MLTALITNSTITSFVSLIVEVIKSIKYNNDNDRIVSCNQLGYFAATHQESRLGKNQYELYHLNSGNRFLDWC